MSREGLPQIMRNQLFFAKECETFYIKGKLITSSSIVIPNCENYIKYYNEK